MKASLRTEPPRPIVALAYHFLIGMSFCSVAPSGLRAEGPRAWTILHGHTKRVNSVAFSPDGKTLASASQDQTVMLWVVATGQEKTTLRGHDASVDTVAFSPDGQTLAAGCFDRTIKLWDLATGKDRATLTGHGREVTSVAFSPDGKTLASGSWDKTVKLWDSASGKNTATLTGHKWAVNSVAFSRDGKALASASEDKTISLWEPATGKKTVFLDENIHALRGVAFSPDGKTLAASSDGGFYLVNVLDMASLGKDRPTFRRDYLAVFSVAFSPDGKTLAAAGNGTITLWEVASGKPRAILKGHGDLVWSVAFSPNGKTLASASEDRTIKLWDFPIARSAVGGDVPIKDLDALWNGLAEDDATKAYQAATTLMAAPQQALALLKGRLQPSSGPSAPQLAGWIADLDSNRFAVRQKAREELEKSGEFVEATLRTKLTEKPSLEVRQQLEQLLIRIEQQPLSGEWFRALRAVEVLEQIAGPEAKQLLATLARGTEGGRLTREARAALDRLKRSDRDSGS